MASFKDFPLVEPLQKALDTLGFTQPTEIQNKAIPILLDQQKVDFHGQAQTGTGKTLAFGIPLLNAINPTKKEVQGIIIAPTRELVVQITDSLKKLAHFMDIDIEAIYGGVSMTAQINALRRGAQVVIGTPGRLNDHLRRGTLRLDRVKTLVLDEADLMLDMGFKEEVDEILNKVAQDRQIWLFSATVKPGIKALKKSHMHDPVSVSVVPEMATASTTEQFFAIIPMRDRLSALCRFIDSTPEFYGFVFCRTKLLASEIADRLIARGYKANAIHGDMSQEMRNKVMQQFKQKESSILVATDVAARGIDVSNATHVINFSLPEDPENYVHRIGRTGRAGQTGVAISFINRSEVSAIHRLGKRLGTEIKPIEVPTKEDVAKIRLHSVETVVQAMCEKMPEDNGFFKQLHDMLNHYTKEEVVNGFARTLYDKYFKELAQEKEIEVATYHPDDRDFSRREGGRGDRRGGGSRGGFRRRSGGRGFGGDRRRDEGHSDRPANYSKRK